MTQTQNISEQTTILGYQIEKNPEDNGEAFATGYWLHGPRGARYALLRTQRNPEFMYVWNERKHKVTSAAGNGWFTDRDGKLEVWA